MATVSEPTGSSSPQIGKNKKLKEDMIKKVKEREAHIDYTLDMVVHDLVSQGHLHPAKSYLLKTPEMREHIGKMCDRLNKRKKEEEAQRRKFLLPKSRSSFVRDSNSSVQSVQRERGLAPSESAFPSKTNTKEDKTETVKDEDSDVAVAKPEPKEATDESTKSLREIPPKYHPWVTPRDIGDDHARRSSLHRENNHNNNNSSSISTTEASRPRIRRELQMPAEMQSIYSAPRNSASAQAYRAKVDMSGFKNDEISLDLDDRRLIITAQRQKKGSQNARKVTEIIDIPEGVNLEHLKIGRRLDGTLLIEEFVPEASLL